MRSRPVLAIAFASLLFAGLVAGCSAGGDDAAAPTTAPTSTTTATTTTTTTGSTEPVDAEAVCPDTAAVEELVGGPVDRQMSGGGVSSSDAEGNSLSYSYQGCAYELSEGGQGEVAVTRITEHDADGPVFDALEADVLRDFDDDGIEPLPDLGDDAYRVGSELAVLTGDVFVMVEVRDDDGEPSAALTRDLTEAILSEGSGLLATSDLDCDELAVVAPVEFGAIDVAMSFPGTTFIDDFSLTTEGCSLTFDTGLDGEIQVAPADQWEPWLAAEQGSLFTVRYTSLEVAGHRAFDDGETLIVEDDPAHPLRVTSEGDDLDPEAAEVRRLLAELALS